MWFESACFVHRVRASKSYFMLHWWFQTQYLLLYLCWKNCKREGKAENEPFCVTYEILLTYFLLWNGYCGQSAILQNISFFSFFFCLLRKIWIGNRVIVSCFKFEWNELRMHTMHVKHWIPFEFGESHTITINTIE